jgi:hypothetical protein
MALPKLETASIAPRPPPTLLEKLSRLDASFQTYGPILVRCFEFITLTSLGALAIIAVVTALLGGIGLALFLLVQGVKLVLT